jgi:hypothetical protein
MRSDHSTLAAASLRSSTDFPSLFWRRGGAKSAAVIARF